jgi:hypothetical protein
MQAVLKVPERAGVGRTVRPVAQFLDRYLRLRVDAAVDRHVVLETGSARQGADLVQDRILHFDCFIEGPLEAESAGDESG